MVLRCPAFNSRMPAWTVVRDRPVARATNDTPPKGKDLASAAAHTRRPRSSNTSPTTRYFSRIAPSSLRPMHQEDTVYLIVQVIYAHSLSAFVWEKRRPGGSFAPLSEEFSSVD